MFVLGVDKLFIDGGLIEYRHLFFFLRLDDDDDGGVFSILEVKLSTVGMFLVCL